ncbi:MAG: DNA recombination protein RmuC [Pseudomonadota bacterium]|nr:DNA recombination protein RmuC [Pseudomonadota bacterium]
MESIIVIGSIAVLIIAGVFFRERLSVRDKDLSRVSKELDVARNELATANQELNELKTNFTQLETLREQENKTATDKQKTLEEAEKRLAEQFENLANRIFDEKHEKFSETSKEGVENLLKPVKEQLDNFRKKVEDVYDKESKDRTSLFNEITNLKQLGGKMSADALNLTQALKGDNKAQGNWGEIQLARVLEESGLEEGREYELQKGAQNKIPDAIIHLPHKRNIIVDSKVSLVAYTRFHSAETDEERQLAIKDHFSSIENHVKSLGSKNYENLVDVKPFEKVIMFIPIESSLYLAYENDKKGKLNSLAEKNNIILTGPKNLTNILIMINEVWQKEQQSRNAIAIADEATKMLDKFESFVSSLMDVGKNIHKAQDAYDEAYKKLSTGNGNLIIKAKKIEKLGIKSKKALPNSVVEQAELDQQLLTSSEGEPANEDQS